MHFKISKYFLLTVMSLFLTNCTSVKKYNQQISRSIPVDELQEDINFVQNKLIKLHPNLYQYISKEKLNFKFDSIRKTTTKPLTSKEFYFVISPVVAAVHQGHMSMSPVLKRTTKSETKRISKMGAGPISQFEFDFINEKLYILKNKSKDTLIKKGDEVLKINNLIPSELYMKYVKTFTSDGFNKTFLPIFFKKRISNFIVNEIGLNDSLTYTFKRNDSIYSKIVKRIKPEKKAKKTEVKVAKVVVDKRKLRKEKKTKRIFGYDKTNKEYAKKLTFLKDSSVAYLQIKNFSQGRYATAYKMVFDSIKKQNCKTLIIDLRNNGGGRIEEVVDLYSYLTDKNYKMLQKSYVTSKTSLWKTGIFKKTPKIFYPFVAIGYPVYMGISYVKTKKVNDSKYTYSLYGSKEKKFDENHFTGKIYVLINGGSFSASCLLSATLKTNPNVTFVGEETGGAFNENVSGLMPDFTLPNSKIPIRIGLIDIRPTNQSNIDGRGIFPDKEIKPTIKDKISSKDTELDWILNEINN